MTLLGWAMLDVLAINPLALAGRGTLLAGAALALPSLMSDLKVGLLACAARTQVLLEGRALSATPGAPYRAFRARLPRRLEPS
jgi:protein-S-isoprenylcysteine O-methyltransferase Ste14